MIKSDAEAAASGVDGLPETRHALIEWRDVALTAGDMSSAVLLSHAIWWLSIAIEVRADG